MWKALQANGMKVSKERVRQTMQQNGIQARGKRKFVVTTDSKHNLPIAPNLLQRNFTATAPNQAWTGDITYIQTNECWLYLAAVQSSMSRKGDCWDNAPTESLWCSLKVGRLYGRCFSTRREAMDEVIDWLTFYNHSRLHSTLNYMSPMQFEARWLAEQRKKSS